jgi:Flp pilus assembly protein TadD
MAATVLGSLAAPVTFHDQIAPLIARHCVSCHRPGGAAPFPLVSADDVRKRFGEIEEVVRTGRMPPWLPAPQDDRFQGERRLSPEEIRILLKWREEGWQQGKSGVVAVPPPVPGGWTWGTPDLVVRMPLPYTVPAAGRDVYRHFVLPTGLNRDVRIAAWEFRAGSRTVHHAFLKFDRKGEARRHDAMDSEVGFPGMDSPSGVQSPNGHFASWQPGAAPTRNPEGMAWLLPAGADLVLQAHLQPSGKPEPLQAEVALWFTDEPQSRPPLKLGLVNYGFVIPPGSTNVTATDRFVVAGDCDLLGLLPHAHYLARRIEATAEFPDGGRRQLLQIPDWDFNWQGAYLYEKPVFLPQGTRVEMRIHFDNSVSNPRNPFDPPRETRFGHNTTDEMAELWLQVLPRSDDTARLLRDAILRQTARDVVAYNRERLRLDPKDPIAFLNLGKALLSRQQTTNAARFLVRAVELAPDSDEAHYQLGLAYRILNALEAARREFQEAVRLHPGNARAWGNLGLVELESGAPTSAATSLRKALDLDPGDALAHAALGSALHQSGRPTEAIPHLRKAVEMAPDDVESRNLLKQLEQAKPEPGTGSP